MLDTGVFDESRAVDIKLEPGQISLHHAMLVQKDGGFELSDLVSTNSSYGLNELGFVDLTDPGVTTPNRMAGFHTPTVTVMLGDVGTEDDMKTLRPDTSKMIAPGSDINDDEDARPIARHNQRCDLGFMDGHAEPMRLSQFYLNQNPTNKWFTP